MNILQQIAAALSGMALCMIIHFGLRNWRSIAQDLGLTFGTRLPKINIQHPTEKVGNYIKVLRGDLIDS